MDEAEEAAVQYLPAGPYAEEEAPPGMASQQPVAGVETLEDRQAAIVSATIDQSNVKGKGNPEVETEWSKGMKRIAAREADATGGCDANSDWSKIMMNAKSASMVLGEDAGEQWPKNYSHRQARRQVPDIAAHKLQRPEGANEMNAWTGRYYGNAAPLVCFKNCELALLLIWMRMFCGC